METERAASREHPASNSECRVLLVTPIAAEAETLSLLLSEADLPAQLGSDIGSLCRELELGAAVVVAAEESLTPEGQRLLSQALADQPEWSDLPLIVLTSEAEPIRRDWELLQELDGGAHTILLPRPVRRETLLSVIRAGIRSRGKQFQIRDELQRRKEVEADLRRSENRFRKIFEHAATGIAITNFSGQFEQCNPAFSDLLGYSEEELRNKNFAELVHPDDLDENLRLNRRLREGELPFFEIENRYVRKNGEPIWVHKIISIIRDDHGAPTSLFALVTDVSARRRAETQLRESEERLRLATSAAQLGVFEWDVATDTARWENPRMYEIFGRSPAEGPLNRAIFESEVVLPDGRTELEQAMSDAVDAGGHLHVVCQIRRRDNGDLRWIELLGQLELSSQREARRVIGVVSDVTERKRKELALQVSEERLRLAAAATGFGTYDANLLTGEVVWSPQMCTIFGVTESTAPNAELFLSLLHPEDRPIIGRRMRQELDPSGPHRHELEYRILRPDGEVRWIRDAGRTMYENLRGTPTPVRMIGTALDVTDRKLAETALRESEERLRDCLEAASAGTWDWNVVTNELIWSPENYRLYGVDPETGPLTFDDWETAVLADDRSAARQLVLDALAGRVAEFRNEFRVVTPGGEIRWLLGLGRVQRADDGTPERMVGINVDITARKEAERQLQRLNESLEQEVEQRTKDVRDREQRLRAILDTAFDAVITIDSHGNVISVNPAAERLFDFRLNELAGHNITMLMPPPYCYEHDSYLGRYLSGGEPRVIGTVREVSGRRKDGTTFPIELAVSEIDHLGIFTGIIRDISRRKELEKHIIDIAEAEQRRIGHELHDGTQQELTGLSLFAGSLIETLNSAGRHEREGTVTWTFDDRGYLRAHRIAVRIAQGLATAHEHVHQLCHGIMPVQIDAEGLRSALQDLARSLNAREDLTCRFRSTGPVAVADTATATHLYRIAQEALTNAVRHSRADRIDILLSESPQGITLQVRDNGQGFDPHEAADRGTPGNGMGLRTMHYRASMIGGVLVVDRGPSGGTVVKCTVPSGRDRL